MQEIKGRDHPWMCPACNGTMFIGSDGNWYCCSCRKMTQSTKKEIVNYFLQEEKVIKMDYELEIKKLMGSKASGQKQEEPTMKVSYNGFTGELVKLERSFCNRGFYNLSIWDTEKKVEYLFTDVNLKDVKFLGCSVFFE